MRLLPFIVVALAALCVAPFVGGTWIDPVDVLEMLAGRYTSNGWVFLTQRLPRCVLGLLVGGSLAVVGAAFQVLFRNPLVEPYTLGMTGGAALGAFCAISVPALVALSFGPLSAVQVCAAIGGLTPLVVLMAWAKRMHALESSTLLLAGITIGIVCSGAIMLITYMVDPYSLLHQQRWVLGSLTVSGFSAAFACLPLTLPSLLALFWHAPELDQISCGEELAFSRGVDVALVRSRVFLFGGIATAAVVALAGPISFVGLLIPHAVRKYMGHRQTRVLPASFLLGGSILILADTIARTVQYPIELPVGIVTALIGGPVFIWLLLHRKTRFS